jgi:hypothetical protein
MNVKYLLSYSFLLMAVLSSLPERMIAGQSPNPERSLTIEEVVKLSQAGLPEELIVAKIKKNGKAFDLNEEELLELKKEGVTDTVVKFLLDPSQPYTPPVQSKAGAESSKRYPDDVHASKVPPEPGLYYFSGELPVTIEIKILLGQKVGGKKGSTVAYLIGPTAKQRIKQSEFYMRLPEKKAIEEVVLVVLIRKENRRELDLGRDSKEEIKPGTVRQFESLEVGWNLFRITTPKLVPGEYLFFLIGSAEPAQGNFGRGYDFGIE